MSMCPCVSLMDFLGQLGYKLLTNQSVQIVWAAQGDQYPSASKEATCAHMQTGNKLTLIPILVYAAPT